MAETKAPPTPADQLCDEQGMPCWWLASAWSKEDIIREFDYNGDMTPDSLGEQWHGCRWTTPEEQADEDWIYDQFGDVEDTGVSTDVVYWHAKPGTPGTYKYWTTEVAPVKESSPDA